MIQRIVPNVEVVTICGHPGVVTVRPVISSDSGTFYTFHPDNDQLPVMAVIVHLGEHWVDLLAKEIMAAVNRYRIQGGQL
jgi:hypothetical protein